MPGQPSTGETLSLNDPVADRLERMDALGLMAGGVAHRLNNLLTAIQGHTWNVRDAIQDEEQREELQEALDACTVAADFASHLLAISGRHWARPRTIDLREVLSALDLGRFVEGQVVFCTNFSTAECRVHADPSHVEQVVANLVRNANDAVSGRGVIQVSVDAVPDQGLEDSSPHGWIEIEVSDNGRGMDDRTIAHAFDPFFTTKEGRADLGLGLSVSYGLVRRMGGSLSLDSRLGGGTQARVRLPAATEPVAGPRPVP